MASNDFENSVLPYLEALDKAESIGEHEFVCPLCGGNAEWCRSSINNHLHSHCFGCGFTIME